MPIENLSDQLRNDYDKLTKNVDEFVNGVPETQQIKDRTVQGFVKGLNTRFGATNDPTFLGFTLMFDWVSSPLFRGMDGAGDFPEGGALNYLNKRGQGKRVDYLRKFSQSLRDINQNMPWYWQTIEGLEDAWTRYNDFTDPYRGGDDAKIGISTLESVDFRISGLMDFYQKSMFDYEYTRWYVPINLRRFNLYIFVEEIRNFTSVQNTIRTFSNNGTTDVIEEIKKNTSRLILEFKDCEFVPAESNAIFGSVTNAGSNEMATQKMVISYHDVLVRSSVPWFEFEIVDNPIDSNVDKTFKEKLANAKDQIKNGIEKRAQELVRNNVRRVTGINNVHGTTPQRLVDTLVNATVGGVTRDVEAEAAALTRVGRNLISDTVAGIKGNIHQNAKDAGIGTNRVPSAPGIGTNVHPDIPPEGPAGNLGNVYE